MTMPLQPPPPEEDEVLQGGMRTLVVERTMPSNIEAEQAVLGSLMLASDEFFRAEITAPEFYLEKHQMIFSAMHQLVSGGGRIDFLTVCSRLEESGKLQTVGGVAYLSALLNAVPSPSHANYYAELVRMAAARRALIQMSTEVAELAYDIAPRTREELFTLAWSKVMAVPHVATSSTRSFSTMVEEWIPRLQQYRLEQREVWGIETHLDIDAFLGGLQQKELLLVAGYPGSGKTSLGTQIAYEVAAQGKGVAFFSLEMSYEALMLRLGSQYTGINSELTRRGKMTPAQAEVLDGWLFANKEIPLHVNDSPQSVASIRVEIARLKAMGVEVGLAIVDYARLVLDGHRDEQQRIPQVMRDLKNLAKEEDVAMVVLHALNRSGESKQTDQDGRKVPSLGNLSYGGEYDADSVVILDRDANRTDATAYMYLLKNRMGRIGRIVANYDEVITRWSNAVVGQVTRLVGGGESLQLEETWNQATLE